MSLQELNELLKAPDEVLVEIWREGSEPLAEAAVEVLFNKYYQKLVSFVRFREVPAMEMEDIVQEALTRALVEKLEQFKSRGPGSFRRWLYTIANRLVIDYHRKLARRLIISLDALLEQGRQFTASEPDAPKEVKMRELLEGAGVSPGDCDIMILRFVHGMEPQDIEATLGIPAEEVSRVTWRVKERVKSKFGEFKR